ncbi:cytochrome b561/polyisoprenoid-binding protein YceI [Sphingobium wenxiniae]|uniref:Polyisoprenoid-binding protein n=2 Tax=Sphingobium TaxID=165695 RepID=T0GS96_9SPHN|nr:MULTISPECIES: YceI family protein [Sphingobium]EQB03567.1 polyisoprenoid-binding protein [Sphingobium baderi LL03]KMS62404.1 polyisoprenoid-binding protein [Sphingobium baderi LL03]MBB6191611.1 cytochrome b561/polyisoprenoid-binding protein YceI [Sphingobium wenxiniae]TWH92788.1 cytochrome b561 [Sphingobium wenxiniae]WRD76553.1 cytochrome b/b6 domain-containing protein [Sphingobium baderi]
MQRYSLAAIFLHWTIAILLAFQISVGWALEDLGARGFALFQLHKSVGITILVLTLARIAVRYWKPRPAPVEGGWQGALAKTVHAGLYLFMLGAPLTGWALVSTAKVKVPTLIFGVIPLPHLPLPISAHELAEGGHGLLAWIGIALFLLHVAGALRHHVLLRDGLIWRMMPARSPVLLVLLPALVLGGLVLGKAILPAPAPKAAAAQPAALNAMDAMEGAEAAPAPVGNKVEAADNAATSAADNVAAPEETPLGPPPPWAVQPGGRIGFSVGNGGETISGSFSRWTAKIAMDPDHPESADIRVDIDLASASVGNAYQDGMLAGDEFFGTAAHPSARFVAKGAQKTGANGYRASGTLTLKGVSRRQSIRFTLSGSGDRRKVSGSATIARAPFGVGNGDSSSGLDPSVSVDFSFSAARR